MCKYCGNRPYDENNKPCEYCGAPCEPEIIVEKLPDKKQSNRSADEYCEIKNDEGKSDVKKTVKIVLIELCLGIPFVYCFCSFKLEYVPMAAIAGTAFIIYNIKLAVDNDMRDMR